MPKNNTNTIHVQRLKAIRPFVNFNYDLRKPLTQYQKSKIKTYFDEIDQLTARPYQTYRPRIKGHLKKAQEFAQHEKQLAGLKVAFIPISNPKQKTKISFNKGGELIAETEHVRTRFIPFDQEALLIDPVQHTIDLIEDSNGKRFSILAGKFEIPNSYSRARLPTWVGKLSLAYSNPDKNNYFGNWMIGLNSHTFKEQSNFDEYRKTKSEAKAKIQKERKNRKRRKTK